MLLKYFGKNKISQTFSHVFITGYDILKDKPEFFRSYDRTIKNAPHQQKGWKKKKDLRGNFLMRDVARATSAAPTYFQGARILDAEGNEYYYVDGGVTVNNPTLAALLEARRIFGNDVNHYVIVSLGTGETPSKNYWGEVEKGGKIVWASHIP